MLQNLLWYRRARGHGLCHEASCIPPITRRRGAGLTRALLGMQTLSMVITCLSLSFMSSAYAQDCPPAGGKFIIKGFTGETGVTATGAAKDPRYGCKWQTDDGRELWWDMGEEVVANQASKPSVGKAPLGSTVGGPLSTGSVYECTLPGIGMFTGAYFGIINSNTYRDFDGRRGNYRYDASTGILRLTSGSSKGLVYKRTSAKTFRVLDDKGNITGGNCVHNSAKKIDGRW